MARILVAGYMIRHPVAGNMLAFFQYLLGFQRLGHQVTYIEESGWPDACYNPQTGFYGNSPDAGIQALRSLMERFDVDIPVLYVDRATGDEIRVNAGTLEAVLSSVDILLNIGGVCSLPEFERVPHRILIDMDPLFTQVGRFASEDLHSYQAYFSYGVNIGQDFCPIPTAGVDWQPTVPPVVPVIWGDIQVPVKVSADETPFTTVCNWSAYGSVSYQGEQYGQKNEEFVRFQALPGRASSRLELALSGADKATRQALSRSGWLIRDAAEVSSGLTAYQRYIAGSRGEFSVAKNAYVKTRSGWFSDRSVCYLAAGRPVIVQDTGASRLLETGLGIQTFNSLEQALDCIHQVGSDYAAHCGRARELAEEVFSYEVVLPRLIGECPAGSELAGQTRQE